MSFFRRLFQRHHKSPRTQRHKSAGGVQINTTISDIRFQVEPCPIPILWLDTSIIFYLTKLRLGTLNDEVQKERVSRLQKRVCDLTRAGKLLCPRAGQPNEIWRERSDCLGTIDELSLGISTRPRAAIEEAQIHQLMTACIAGTRFVTFPYTDLFIDDPVHRLEMARLSNYGVTIDTPPSVERIKEIKFQHDTIRTNWERLRKTCAKRKVTFDQQLEVERSAGMTMTVTMARDCCSKLMRGEKATPEEISSFLYVKRLIHTWDRLGGEPKGFEGLVRFCSSQYCQIAPSVSISSALVAKFVTEKARNIQPGDYGDVEHISSILPYANLMIIDKSMKSIVQGLDLDKNYGVTVCYIGDDTIIEDFFETVGKSTPYHSSFPPVG